MSENNEKNQIDPDLVEEEGDDEGHYVEVIDLDAELDQDAELAKKLGLEINMMNEDEDDDMEDADEDENLEEEDDTNFVDDSIVKIKKHDGSVFCVDSFKNYLASGGEDDKMYLWCYTDDIINNNNNQNGDDEDYSKKLQLLIESEKFKDSVTNVKFSCDGKYVAACDMSGIIRVYLIETKELHWQYDVENDVECMDWHPNCNVLFCGTSDGNFFMFKLSTNEIKIMYCGEEQALSCFRILKDGKRAACCYNNGSVRIWDLKTSQPLFNYSNAHENEILCMDLSSDGNLLATGGVDMKIHLVNTLNGKFIAKLDCSFKKKQAEAASGSSEDEEDSIESIAFSKNLPLLACATLNGSLIVWDMNTHMMRSKHENENKLGYSKLVWTNVSSTNPSLNEIVYASSLDGTVQVYDGRNLQLIKKFTCHKSEILDFCLNNTLNLFITGSNDSLIKVFKQV